MIEYGCEPFGMHRFTGGTRCVCGQSESPVIMQRPALEKMQADLAAAQTRADRLAGANAELRATLQGIWYGASFHAGAPDPMGLMVEQIRRASFPILSTAPETRGAEILEAANALADVAESQARVWGALVDGNALRAAAARYRALAGGQEE